MGILLLTFMAAFAGGNQAYACWACDAGPDEECYLEDYWSPQEELAGMSVAAGSCGPGSAGTTMSMSTGAVFSLECEGGKVQYRQLAPGHVIKVRPLTASTPRSEAGPLPQGETEGPVEMEQAREVCARGPNLPACNEAHAAMMKKAQRMLSSAAPK